MTNAELQLVGIDEAAFNAASEEQRVEWAKANTTAGFGLCKAALEWLQNLRKGVGTANCTGMELHDIGTVAQNYNTIYRLSPDYQPPVKRWWFDTETKQVINDISTPAGVDSIIEVTAEYAAYLQAKPEGDWELRKPKKGDITHDETDGQWQAMYDFEDDGPSDRGYRWCKSRKVDVNPARYIAKTTDGIRYVWDEIGKCTLCHCSQIQDAHRIAKAMNAAWASHEVPK